MDIKELLGEDVQLAPPQPAKRKRIHIKVNEKFEDFDATDQLSNLIEAFKEAIGAMGINAEVTGVTPGCVLVELDAEWDAYSIEAAIIAGKLEELGITEVTCFEGSPEVWSVKFYPEENGCWMRAEMALGVLFARPVNYPTEEPPFFSTQPVIDPEPKPRRTDQPGGWKTEGEQATRYTRHESNDN